MLDYTKVRAGQTVALMSNGRHPQGLYTVTKADKMKIVVQRVGDNYERSFSVKKECEINSYSTRYNTDYIESVEVYEEIQAANDLQATRNKLWRDLDAAVNTRNVAKCQELILQLA